MRVIKRGRPKVYEFKVVCWWCESELAVTRDDAFCGCDFYAVRCPVCGAETKYSEDQPIGLRYTGDPKNGGIKGNFGTNGGEVVLPYTELQNKMKEE